MTRSRSTKNIFSKIRLYAGLILASQIGQLQSRVKLYFGIFFKGLGPGLGLNSFDLPMVPSDEGTFKHVEQAPMNRDFFIGQKH